MALAASFNHLSTVGSQAFPAAGGVQLWNTLPLNEIFTSNRTPT